MENIKVLSTVPQVLPRNNYNSFKATTVLARVGINNQGTTMTSGSKGRRDTGTETSDESRQKAGERSLQWYWLLLSFEENPESSTFFPQPPLLSSYTSN